MDVASLSHLPVGVLGWNSPDPSLTIVVKATFTLAGDQVLLSPEQEPIGADRAHPQSENELYAPSDFAPQKRDVDLLLVGHARSRTASTVLPFAVTVGDKRILLHALSDAPNTAIPLLERNVRRQPSDPASAVRLAPRRTAVRGWLSRTVAPGFDFAAFNAAPPEHRVTDLAADARLILEGLLATTPQRELRLPGLSAFVWHMNGRDLELDPEAVPMRCDTLWLDVDREVLTLTWRGICPRRAPPHRPAAVVLLADHAPSWPDVLAQLTETAWQPAVQSHEIAPRRFDDDAAPSELEPTLSGLNAMPLSLSRPEDDEPTLRPAPPSPAPSTWADPPTVRAGGGTWTMEDPESADAEIARARAAFGGTVEMVPDEGQTVRMEAVAPPPGFGGVRRRAAPPARRQRATDPMPEHPPDSQSPPTVKPPLSLDNYVRIRAAVESKGDREETLRGENLTVTVWEQAHEFWTARAKADPSMDAELHARLWLARKNSG